MKKANLFLIIVFLLAISVNVAFGVVPLSACGNLNVANTVYELQNDVTSSGTCFVIGANDITLDLNGFTIVGAGSSGDGVASVGTNNIVIKNGRIQGFTNNGLTLNSVSNSNFYNLTITSNINNGLSITTNSNNNNFHNMTLISNTNLGLFLHSSLNNRFYDTTVTLSNNLGIYMASNSNNNQFYNLDSYSNTGVEFLVSSSTGNILIYNNSFGEIKFAPFGDVILEGTLRFGDSQPIKIGNNFAYFNSSMVPALNVPANITLNLAGWSFTNPVILRDGVVCADCYNFTSLTDNLVIFSVTSWSNYSIGGGTFCTDADGDGWNSTAECNYNLVADCDDTNHLIYPGATEICDGLDNDCEEGTEDGLHEFWYGAPCDGPDSDLCEEGYMSCSSGVQSCTDTSPDNIEICDNIDNDCDGLVDEGIDGINNSLWKNYYLDSDSDSYGSDSVSYFGCYISGYSEVGGDCDDSDPNIYPGATEICNLKDDNCNGKIDTEDGLSCTEKSGDIPTFADYNPLLHYFYINGTNPIGLNPQTINLNYGETQTLTYRVYAPGPYNSNHNIFAYAKMNEQTVARSNSVDVGILGEGVVDISTFDSVVINATNGHVWQSGDSSATLAWDLTGSYDLRNCSDLIYDGVVPSATDYPACTYCYNLALCNNGSFDSTGACSSGDYGGAVNGYGRGDWRLPEKTVYDLYDLNTYFRGEQGFFFGDVYWTGTTHTPLFDLAYSVLLYEVRIDGIGKLKDGNRARCVSDLI